MTVIAPKITAQIPGTTGVLGVGAPLLQGLTDGPELAVTGDSVTTGRTPVDDFAEMTTRKHVGALALFDDRVPSLFHKKLEEPKAIAAGLKSFHGSLGQWAEPAVQKLETVLKDDFRKTFDAILISLHILETNHVARADWSLRSLSMAEDLANVSGFANELIKCAQFVSAGIPITSMEHKIENVAYEGWVISENGFRINPYKQEGSLRVDLWDEGSKTAHELKVRFFGQSREVLKILKEMIAHPRSPVHYEPKQYGHAEEAATFLSQVRKYGAVVKSGAVKHVEYHFVAPFLDDDVVRFMRATVPSVKIVLYDSILSPLGSGRVLVGDTSGVVGALSELVGLTTIKKSDYRLAIDDANLEGYKGLIEHVIIHNDLLRDEVMSGDVDIGEWMGYHAEVARLFKLILETNKVIANVGKLEGKVSDNDYAGFIAEYFEGLSGYVINEEKSPLTTLAEMSEHFKAHLELLTELQTAMQASVDSVVGVMREDIDSYARRDISNTVAHQYGFKKAPGILSDFIGSMDEQTIRDIHAEPDLLGAKFIEWTETDPEILREELAPPREYTKVELASAKKEINRALTRLGQPEIEWQRDRSDTMVNKNARRLLANMSQELGERALQNPEVVALSQDVGNFLSALSGQPVPENAPIVYQRRKPDTYFNTAIDGPHLIDIMIRFQELSD